VSDKLAELERRRQRLIFQSAVQRDRLVENCHQLANSLRLVRLARSFIQRLTTNPGSLIRVPALLGGTRRTKFRRLTGVLSLGWAIFRAVQARRRRPRA
jgi:hypothetical protein